MQHVLPYLFCLLALALSPAVAAIPEYEFQDLTYNGQTLLPLGISNDGTIVGNTTRGPAFVLRDGVLTLVDVPGSVRSGVTGLFGINPSGTMCVGTYGDLADWEHSFEYRISDGSIRYLPDLGDSHTSTVATDITDSGLIVGSTYTYKGHPAEPGIPFSVGEAFVMQRNTVRTYSAPGAAYTQIGGVNEAGKMVGYWMDDPPSLVRNPFVLDGEAFAPLPLPGGSLSLEVTDINNKGQIVGWQVVPGVSYHGFLLEGRNRTIIRHPGGDTRIHGINDSGVIVGYRYEGTSRRGFIAYPKNAIPEPSSLALLLAGLPLVWVRRRS